MKTPHISAEIIEYLNELYPEKSPEITWGDREIWLRSGQRSVVRKLIAQYEDQIRRSMTNKE